MCKRIITLLVIAVLSLVYCSAKDYCTVADEELCLRAKPAQAENMVHLLIWEM